MYSISQPEPFVSCAGQFALMFGSEAGGEVFPVSHLLGNALHVGGEAVLQLQARPATAKRRVHAHSAVPLLLWPPSEGALVANIDIICPPTPRTPYDSMVNWTLS